MIIVEGPDGAGKSTLIKRLTETLGIPVADRMSTSQGGPIEGLYTIAARDVINWPAKECHIYDRHAFISEYIYGPICRGTLAESMGDHTARWLRKQMARKSIVILCLPGEDVARGNLAKEKQMPGVVNSFGRIYAAYCQFPMTWDGWVMKYDYTLPEDTKPGGYQAIHRACVLHAMEWNRDHG